MADGTDHQNPFSDDANWADNAPLLSETRPSRPTTPRRSTSIRSVKSHSPQSKSGIVFGTPRSKRRLSNPFSDLHAGQTASITTPTAPAKTLVYIRRTPDETESSMLQNVHATPGNNDEQVDEKYESLAAGIHVDDEEEALNEKLEVDSLKTGGRKSSRRSFFSSLFGGKRKYTAVLDPPAPNRPVIARMRKRIVLVVVSTIVLAALFMLSVLNVRQPQVHWKGTLSDSTGLVEPTGFNFTRHINLGFTNPNLLPVQLAGVKVWAAYVDELYFGFAENNHVGLPVAGLNRRNTSLPVEMNFAYISSQDPANWALKALIVECGNTGSLNFELIVHAKVKALGFIPYTAQMARLDASMTCDNNMVVLAQDMLVKATPTGYA